MNSRRNIPEEFRVRLKNDLGEKIASRVINALENSEERATPSIRLNFSKGANPGRDLRKGSISFSGGSGFNLSVPRPIYAYDPAWHAGMYYVQDASSMAVSTVYKFILSNFLQDRKNLTVLDACAAPGGKTIAAIEAVPEGSLVVANEFERKRLPILIENLQKWGYADVAVTSCDTKEFLKVRDIFDIIAVDAPCSGEGMMRKEDEAVIQWSPSLVRDCSELQRVIVSNVMPALRPGGFLIYSTCTLNRAENEENVRYFEDTFGLERIPILEFENDSSIVTLEKGTARFMPGFYDGEGLFIAVLRKPGEQTDTISSKKQKNASTVIFNPENILGADFEGVCLRKNTETIFGVHNINRNLTAFLDRTVGLISAGIPIGQLKGKTLIPSHGLALSTSIRKDAFPRYDLHSYPEAISFLRGESFGELKGLSTSERGPVLVCFDGTPLGFLKNLGQRANNLFPQSLRLKTLPQSDYFSPTLVEPKDSKNL